jgi:acetyl esterase/lipase
MGRLKMAIFVCLLMPAAVSAQTRVERNVVYGMYSGLALLMDVHRPETPNGLGIIYVYGSGWQAPVGYDAPGLKDNPGGAWTSSLLRAGYTVFAINYRAAPRFHYPAAIDDVQRAIRYIRNHATQFEIDGRRLGGVGGSSGAHLVGLAAMLAAPGLADDADPVNREPATLQTVVLRAAPLDLTQMRDGSAHLPMAVFMNALPPGRPAGAPAATPPPPGASSSREVANAPANINAYTAASPLAHVTASSPPVLLIHGDADGAVPFQQSVAMEATLRAVKVPTKLVRLAGGNHGDSFQIEGGQPHPALPNALDEMVRWLNQYLKGD